MQHSFAAVNLEPQLPFFLQVGELIGSLVAKDVFELEGIAKAIISAGNEETPEGEDAQLVDSGVALSVIAVTLKQIEAQSNPERAQSSWKGTSLQIDSFIASVSS